MPRLGWHFRYSTDADFALGRAIAGCVVTHLLLRRARKDDLGRR